MMSTEPCSNGSSSLVLKQSILRATFASLDIDDVKVQSEDLGQASSLIATSTMLPASLNICRANNAVLSVFTLL